MATKLGYLFYPAFLVLVASLLLFSGCNRLVKMNDAFIPKKGTQIKIGSVENRSDYKNANVKKILLNSLTDELRDKNLLWEGGKKADKDAPPHLILDLVLTTDDEQLLLGGNLKKGNRVVGTIPARPISDKLTRSILKIFSKSTAESLKLSFNAVTKKIVNDLYKKVSDDNDDDDQLSFNAATKKIINDLYRKVSGDNDDDDHKIEDLPVQVITKPTPEEEVRPPKPQPPIPVTPEVPMGQRVALVIGNSSYKELPLENPVNDAQDIAETLRNLKFEVTEIKNGSKRQMLKAIDDFGNRLHQAKVGLFFYAGHGVQYQGNNYLIPVQAEITSPADLEQEAVDARRISGRMADSQTDLNIVILDACRDNPFSKRSGFRSYGSNRGFAVLPQVRGSLIAYSTQPDNVAADGTGRNSPYTKHLLQHLKQQSQLSVIDLFNEVGQSVLKETNGKQQPWVSHSPLPRFCFGGCN